MASSGARVPRMPRMRRRMRPAAVLPVHRHSVPQVLVDAGLVALSYYLAYQLRFDGAVTPLYQDLFERDHRLRVVGSVVCFAIFGLYRQLVRYATRRDYLQIARAVVVATFSLLAYVALVQPKLVFNGQGFISINVPTGVLALYGLLMLRVRRRLAVPARRASTSARCAASAPRRDARSVLIVGAGDGGRLLAARDPPQPRARLPPGRLRRRRPAQARRARRPRHPRAREHATSSARILDDVEPDEVLIAVPSAPGTMRARVVHGLPRARRARYARMPTVFELLQTGGRLMRQVREVKVEDVLGREPVRMEVERVGRYLTGRVVLVTGAGGSIGAELCRQIARVGPSRLVLLDHAEDNLFEIHRELVDGPPRAQHASPCWPTARRASGCARCSREHRPAVVFHAAAYKHVGLMEDNPVEAVRNNAIATRVMCHVAGEAGIARLRARLDGQGGVAGDRDGRLQGAGGVGASRRPTSASRARRYCAVRFGNVLGSSGSVVPIFRRQIAARRPGDGHRRAT